MTKIYCTKRIEFDSGHRVPTHDGICRMLHGHRYSVEATFVAEKLNSMGMVIDFAIIKKKLKTWIDDNLDHNVIFDTSDQELGELITKSTGQRIFYLDAHPTAENLALYLFEEVCPKLFAGYKEIKCSKIRLYETPSSFAEVC